MGVTFSQKAGDAAENSGFASYRAQLAVILGTLAVCLLMLEVGLRVTKRFQSDGFIGYHVSRGVSYGLQANAAKRISWPTFSFTVYTDDQGFRFKHAGPRVLGGHPYWAVLGSSEVFGNGLDYDQTFVGVFGDKMARDGIDIVNMSVPGQHLLEQVALFKSYAVSAYPMPKVVVICFNPLFIGGYDNIHEDVTVKMGYLVEKKSWKIALTKVFLSDLSATYCFLRDSIRHTQLRYFSRKDFDISFYEKTYSKRHSIRTTRRTEDFLKNLKEFEGFIRGLGATPVCVYSPAVGGFHLNELIAKGQLDGEQFETAFFPNLIQQHCRSEGIQFINLESPLQVLYDKGEKLNFDLDAHFNGPTSRFLGEYLYDAIKSGNGVIAK